MPTWVCERCELHWSGNWERGPSGEQLCTDCAPIVWSDADDDRGREARSEPDDD